MNGWPIWMTTQANGLGFSRDPADYLPMLASTNAQLNGTGFTRNRGKA